MDGGCLAVTRCEGDARSHATHGYVAPRAKRVFIIGARAGFLANGKRGVRIIYALIGES